MKCPIDDAELVMSERQGIEIDYCPKCRGVWLDRGELDKIIERSATNEMQAQDSGEPPGREQSTGHGEHRDTYSYRGRKKKSLLGELFDF
ncbi:zf-TFIIB domain-containing protein [Mesorhizobium sp. STM 4661]|uniref:TFIIB-type zinc ribbon-containing protein n=1 Tax=Mesorhizobium sp. STM 4661 TaxID=1297570 RepID=UPI0009DB3BAD|nr:zf-TFIIB domain-containing protein [Mesorhizobium sp. STM 4661]